MPRYYGDIEVVERRRIRVLFDSKKEPTRKLMLTILKGEKFEDITDEESLEYKEVLSIDVSEEQQDEE